jgi:hypothetical protein
MKSSQKKALFLLALMLHHLLAPTYIFALTSGPTQPELATFQAAGTSDMVDLFTGDFSYNIPLFELPGPDGGYPINLFYNSVTDAEQESSIVGLGWNIGLGSITRQMRGVPDDFNGEELSRRLDMKADITSGVGLGANAEFFGMEDSTLRFNVGISGMLLYNSHKGYGYSISPSIRATKGFGLAKIGGGFGINFNTLDGATAGLNFSASGAAEKKDREYSLGMNLGLNFDSKEGGLMDRSLGLTASTSKKIAFNFNSNFGAFGYVRNAYTPQISMPTVGRNIATSISFATPNVPVINTLEMKINGFYAIRRIAPDFRNLNVFVPAYGAMYHQNATENSIQEINRENDAPVRFKQSNLAVPSFTTDLLSVTGQGVAGTYQLYRSDIPILSDKVVESNAGGFALDVEMGTTGGVFRIGGDLDINWANDKTIRPFSAINQRKAYSKTTNTDFEPYYYKLMGEPSAEANPASRYAYMGGNEPVRLKLNNLEFDTTLLTKTGVSLPDTKGRDIRKTRSNSIQPITNKELLKSDNSVLLPEYRVRYYDKSSQPTNITAYDTSTRVGIARTSNDQIAGYSVVGDGGTKWNYALPAINKTQVDATFSVAKPENACTKRVPIALESGDIDYKIAGTDEYLDMNKVPAYAHSYLLTSVVGSNYIDTDITDGEPNEKDLGYWVRMEYNKTSNNYKWRTPFSGATYIKGYTNKISDDKAAFTYGEREQYYPARLVSKTHVAEFYYSKKNDGRAAYTMLQNSSDAYKFGDYSYKLDSIAIFTQIEKTLAAAESRTAVALKTVHFRYNYAFCKNVENNAVSGGGKLMLERVFFTYEKNTRGELSPYQFEYNNNDSTINYNEFASDRWGVYTPIVGGNECQNIESPFVNQNASETSLDANIQAWHLTDVYLPSGAHIKVDIGRDHYSHEQNKVAGQMFKLRGLETYNSNTIPVNKNPSANELKIFFDLESNGIPTSFTSQQQKTAIQQYFTDLYTDERGQQLFFQINSDLLKFNDLDLHQDITGYAHIDSFGIDLSYSLGGHYKRGFIILKEFPIPVKNDYYHPFAITGWQFIKQSLTEQMYYPGTDTSETSNNDEESNQEIIDRINRLSARQSVVGLFKDYYRVCSDRNYARNLNLSKSYIRLNTPDRKMYGDGVRVKKVLLYDNWTDEDTPVYGTVYDYDEEEIDPNTNLPTGRMISSGTASYTPMIGKQESSLRYTKAYIEDLRWRQDMLYVTEYPLNESYYPAAGVGYRKVTVKSLATDYAIKRLNGQTLPPELPNDLPQGFATSGVTVHQFYTYKDFPIVVSETQTFDKTNPIKFINAIIFNSFTNIYAATQGYSIDIPNMHGKPFKVTNYAQDNLGNVLPTPISWVQYDYKHTEVFNAPSPFRPSTRVLHKILNNTVDVVCGDVNPSNATQADIKTNYELGVDREFFVDARETSQKSSAVGFSFNMDIIPVFAMVFGLPNLNLSEEVLRTAVTNKIIRRSGILTKTTAYDGQSKVVTENKLFDPLTGRPLLTVVNNNYDDPVYNYDIPGYFAYDRMGAAYSNWGILFTGQVGVMTCGYYPLNNVDTAIASKLAVGDEYILSSNSSSFKTRATLIEKSPNNTGTNYILKLAFDDAPPTLPGDYNFLVIRSGYRNILAASVGNITALADPTINRGVDSCYGYAFGGYPSQTQSVCIPPTWANQLVHFLNMWVEYGPCLYLENIGTPPKLCDINIRNAWNALATKVECSFNTAKGILPTGYLNNLLINFLGQPDMPLVTIHSAYNLATPLTTISAANIQDTLSAAYNAGNIVNHEVFGCVGSSPNIRLQLLITVKADNGNTKKYVVALSAMGCLNNLGTNGTQTVYSYDSTQIDSIPLAYRMLNKVLSISATTYKDNFSLNSDNCSLPASSQGANLFQEGIRGIYRMFETWTYVADRNQSTPINLRTDGDMDAVPLFDWQSPFNTMFCSIYDKWKKTTTVTQYSGINGEAVESKNIINQYSSAIYGYNGALPVAVAANAMYYENAFEGFEEHAAVDSTASLTTKESGNFRFIANACSTVVAQTYPTYGLFNSSASSILLDVPYSSFSSILPQAAVFAITNGISTQYTFNTPITGISQFLVSGNTYPMLNYNTQVSCVLPSYTGTSALDAKMRGYRGIATLYYKQSIGGDPQLGIVDSVAHTGTKSLRLPANGVSYLPQRALQLIKGKQYVISLWVYTGNKNKHSYQDDFNLIVDVSAYTFKPKGSIIEGWQRVEGIFEATTTQPLLVLYNKTAANIFLDDIRLHPKDAGFQTYIYDPVSYRVTEILDNNNYFARYKYDRQGSLISVQKETERGIKTIQETGSFTKDVRQ